MALIYWLLLKGSLKCPRYIHSPLIVKIIKNNRSDNHLRNNLKAYNLQKVFIKTVIFSLPAHKGAVKNKITTDHQCNQNFFTDSKPFRCKVCSRRFRRKDNLERHIRNTHPDYVPASAVDCDEGALSHLRGGLARPAPDHVEKNKLEILNPLPPLSKEVIQKHIMEVNENISQNNQKSEPEKKELDKSFILEANHARQSVIVGKCSSVDKKVGVNQENEYIHKIRKANSMVSHKNIMLPPINEDKIRELEVKTSLNNLDVGAPPKDVELYKKILYEKSEIDLTVGVEEESKPHSTSPVHWRRKMKNMTINW